MPDIADVVNVFEPKEDGEGAFIADHLDEGHQVVFGGQLLAIASRASRAVPDEDVLSLIAVRPGAARSGSPLRI